ncbi:MAG: hypothetical protein KME25_33215 [Symplocastrum torsivum CPER-KK1]|uniref:Uncharacterized protein n=1 Tax=Symplocastrum torsivum CPER-KK1 TaxID=450513 RepID=A0A951PSC1_9CYAN|nr:hypothetical protein [Symplocastrum torsivum CPER-KK1]
MGDISSILHPKPGEAWEEISDRILKSGSVCNSCVYVSNNWTREHCLGGAISATRSLLVKRLRQLLLMQTL